MLDYGAASVEPAGHSVHFNWFKPKLCKHVIQPLGPHYKQLGSHMCKESLKFLIPQFAVFDDFIVILTFCVLLWAKNLVAG